MSWSNPVSPSYSMYYNALDQLNGIYMKNRTPRLGIALMGTKNLWPSRIFDEMVVTLDQVCSMRVEGMVDDLPTVEPSNKCYIISAAERKDQICYYCFLRMEWVFIKPKEGMTFFCEQFKDFVSYYEGQGWVKCQQYKEQEVPVLDLERDGDCANLPAGFTKFYVVVRPGACAINLAGVAGRHFEIVLTIKPGMSLAQVEWIAPNVFWSKPLGQCKGAEVGDSRVHVIAFYPLKGIDGFLGVLTA